MAVMTPSGTTGYNIQRWRPGAQAATYQAMVAIPIFDDVGRPLNQMNIRKHARVTSTTLAQSADGSDLGTAQTLAATPATLTPAGNQVFIAWSINEDSQVEFEITPEAKSECERALAEGSDQSVLANVATFTQTMSTGSITGPVWRQAVGRVMGNTNGMSMPGAGGAGRIYGIISHTQYPNLSAIEEFNNAQMRGDSENPYVKGFFTTAGGVMVSYTTVITQDANGWHNFVGRSDAIAIGWNRRTLILEQDLLLQKRVILYNNFGSTVQFDLRGLDLRSTASGL